MAEAEAEAGRFVVLGDEAMTADMVLRRVHPQIACEGRPCSIHNPTDHHMRTWDLGWDPMLVAMLRLCPHDTWHPDPDQVWFWEHFRPLLAEAHYSAHVLSACDGCCTPPGGDTSPLGGDDTGNSTVDNGGA